MRMLNFLRDREKYPYKGELTKYINGDKIVFHYRYNENETMENDYYEGKNELVLRCVIEIEGEPKIVVGDKVVLQNGQVSASIHYLIIVCFHIALLILLPLHDSYSCLYIRYTVQYYL